MVLVESGFYIAHVCRHTAAAGEALLQPAPAKLLSPGHQTTA